MGAVFPINVKFGKKERTAPPVPRAKFHVYRGKVSPLRAEKPIFGPLSKNNTGNKTPNEITICLQQTSHVTKAARIEAFHDPKNVSAVAETH